jgi:hypothetical protein
MKVPGQGKCGVVPFKVQHGSSASGGNSSGRDGMELTAMEIKFSEVS